MSDPSPEQRLKLDGVRKTFRQGGRELTVLRDITLEVNAGELVALVGPSGSGKSTLLHIAGLLERQDAGEVMVRGRPSSRLADRDRTALRRNTVGFVYQHHHLLPEFSALENVIVPQLISGVGRAEARARSSQLLDMVGLSERAEHRPARLSGGEQQRVAIARALANAPTVLLADEPTGNLDPQTAESVFASLERLVRDSGLAGLVATHNFELADRMDRTLRLENGSVVGA